MGGVIFALGGLPERAQVSNLSSNPGCVKPLGGFLIVASDSGYNDSADHVQAHPSQPYPLITVSKGSDVTITVCDQSRVETHGFAVDHYFPAGRVLAPGESFTLSFGADQAGTFAFYCNVLCPIHEWMLQGEIVVK